LHTGGSATDGFDRTGGCGDGATEDAEGMAPRCDMQFVSFHVSEITRFPPRELSLNPLLFSSRTLYASASQSLRTDPRATGGTKTSATLFRLSKSQHLACEWRIQPLIFSRASWTPTTRHISTPSCLSPDCVLGREMLQGWRLARFRRGSIRSS